MPLFLVIHVFCFVRFQEKVCILHHFTFLDWLPPHIFLRPITHFLPLKSYFLTTISPFLVLFLMVLRGFVYAIGVYFYAFRYAFSSFLACVQHQNTLHLAPKRIAFSTKTHCVQYQNALRFAAYCTSFCCKQPKNWCKWRFFEINIHFTVCTS